MESMVSELILSLVKECLLPKLVEEAGSYAIQRAKGGLSATQPVAAARGPRWSRPPARLSAAQATRPALHVVPATSVVSATPGRARLHMAGLRGDPARARAAAARVTKLPGVYQATASAITGNLLVEFDEAHTSLARIRLALEHPLAARSKPAGSCAPASRRQLRLVGF